MKKTNLVFLVLMLGSIFLISARVSIPKIPDELIVSPDPDNPFQGTWVVSIGNVHYMHVINGLNGAWYVNSKTRISSAVKGWTRQVVYIIEQTENGYITSNNWRIRIDGNILTVEQMTYERYNKH